MVTRLVAVGHIDHDHTARAATDYGHAPWSATGLRRSPVETGHRAGIRGESKGVSKSPSPFVSAHIVSVNVDITFFDFHPVNIAAIDQWQSGHMPQSQFGGIVFGDVINSRII